MKYRIVHSLQKYLLNPPVKFLFAIGLVPPGRALLETTGRKTGKARRTPVGGNGRVGAQFWIVAEHGQKAAYVRNIADNPRVRLKLRWAACSLAQRNSSLALRRRSTRPPTLALDSAAPQRQ
jgi:deazaflavin-dependent oxidoreductase (nitroreductase family)